MDNVFRNKVKDHGQQKKTQDEIEFELLVAEVTPLGFVTSKELSSYIVKNKLYEKYGNISGILRMEKSGIKWDFKGGFSKKIYARLCSRLGLNDEGTSAKATDFKSFKELKN